MKENILGIDVTPLDYGELISSIMKDIDQGRKAFIVAINPEKIMKAQKDPDLKKLLNRATYQIPDGIGVIIASKLKGGNIRSRVTGIDLMMKLCQKASQNNKSVFLYGAKPEVVEEARNRLIKQFPGLRVAGVIHGYENDQEKILSTINLAKPDILFVGLGSPRQEYWILENMDKLNVHIFQGVGGSFDVISGNLKRAPEALQKIGLEWFYRLIKEPWRWRRQLVLVSFLYRVLLKRA